ncbi:hypothetical protein BAY15_0006 [Stenotrophomonas rhizophila]|nr:hypothetical protein BAY15_0006 [Stenotrophomonas rhizophila]
MPLGFPFASTATPPPPSAGGTGATTRSWVPVHQSYQRADPQWQGAPPSYGQAMEQDLPTYDAATGQGAARLSDDGSLGAEATTRRLGCCRAVPQQVTNEPGASSSPSYAYASTTPEHPQVQVRELNKLLKRIARNENKLDTAYGIMLEDTVDRYVRQQVLRNFCGGGLFDDSASENASLAERNYRHYAKKLPKLKADYAAMLDRT